TGNLASKALVNYSYGDAAHAHAVTSLSNETNTYLYGNTRIAQHGATSTDYFLVDALGSVRKLADADSESPPVYS
ncbi:MAG: hypothetical protein JXA78_19470, partial [Anaerolineales bacterium]|nr:hypothetical protein [Anaerolineales bacterium]